MIMNTHKKNQKAILRETRNSMLDEQSEGPIQDLVKQSSLTTFLNDPMNFQYPQTSNNSTPSKQSTSNNLEPNSKYLICTSQANISNKVNQKQSLARPIDPQKSETYSPTKHVLHQNEGGGPQIPQCSGTYIDSLKANPFS